MYDDLADLYDRFIGWPARLARELPPLLAWLGEARRVADVACGTGQHALALAERGFDVVGFDASEEALARARAAGGDAHFVTASFGALAARGEAPFEALLCLGNSLPHVTEPALLQATLADFAALLRPGGRMLVHLRNLPLARARDERWLPLKAETDPDGTEWLFERLYDFLPADLVLFHFNALIRPPGAAWLARRRHTLLRGWHPAELEAALDGWHEVTFWGNIAGAPFDPQASGDIWLTARR